jgi:hypothetical protein
MLASINKDTPETTTDKFVGITTEATNNQKYETDEFNDNRTIKATMVPQIDPKANRDIMSLQYCNLHSYPPIQPKCYLNNSYCGDWNVSDRTFTPAVNPMTHEHDSDQCQLRLFTSAEARKCLGNRTLTFIGDSMIRDLGIAIGLFLQDKTIEESLDARYIPWDPVLLDGWIDRIPYLEMWGESRGDGWGRGFVFPSANRSHFFAVTNRTPDAEMFHFQVQFFWLQKNHYLFQEAGASNKSHLMDILEGTVLKDPMMIKVGGRKTDYLFWSYGLHDYGFWLVEGQNPVSNFYRNIHRHFRDNNKHYHFPAVWVSLNSNCAEKLRPQHYQQAVMMNKTNQELGAMLKPEHWPYYDADMVLRSPALCNVSADGTYCALPVSSKSS